MFLSIGFPAGKGKGVAESSGKKPEGIGRAPGRSL